MNDQTTIDEGGNEILDPRKALAEQTLAVDLARVELDHAIGTAHKFPRIIDTVIKKISTLALYNREAAESCIYALPRGGKPIIGPSIGFANIVAQAWGNCRVIARITFIDTKQKVVIAEGGFLDLESNTQSIVPVNRRIVDSKGRLYSEDMQIVTGMAAASIARRNAILQGVSRGLWHPIWMEALGIVRGSVQTFAENKTAAFAALAQFGVTPEKVILYLGLKGDADMTFEHIPTLRGMYQALRDGTTTVEEMFDPRRMTGKGFETVDNPLGRDQADPDEGTDGMSEMAAADQPGPATAAEKPAAGKPAAVSPQNGAQKLTSATKRVGEPAGGVTELPAAELPLDQKNEPTTAPKPGKAASEPATGAEYVVHWRATCAKAASAALVQQLYTSERALRGRCKPFTAEEFEEVATIKDNRIAELRA